MLAVLTHQIHRTQSLERCGPTQHTLFRTLHGQDALIMRVVHFACRPKDGNTAAVEHGRRGDIESNLITCIFDWSIRIRKGNKDLRKGDANRGKNNEKHAQRVLKHL